MYRTFIYCEYYSALHCRRAINLTLSNSSPDPYMVSLKTKGRFGFLIPENIRTDILFMSLAYAVAKLFVNMFIFIYVGGHLGHFLDLEKNAIPFYLDLHDILSQNEVKNQF